MKKECRHCGALERADGSCDCVREHGGIVRFRQPQRTIVNIYINGQHISAEELSQRLGLRVRNTTAEYK